MNTDDNELYKNEMLLAGAEILFPELTPLAALQHQLLVDSKKLREPKKRVPIARYVAGIQGRVHVSLKYAIVS